ncbi:hypothetical protein V7O62_02630 [Methanolobus sp. ZRKC2]|uniref:hypothetical protein n=1 Tax=Methanolobus sp. ZRKC2 TaxID=3125783 RepID=UPI00324CF8F4
MKPTKNWTKSSDLEHNLAAVVTSEDDDADYRPILQGVINTRCTYDGGKIEGSLEG